MSERAPDGRQAVFGRFLIIFALEVFLLYWLVLYLSLAASVGTSHRSSGLRGIATTVGGEVAGTDAMGSPSVGFVFATPQLVPEVVVLPLASERVMDAYAPVEAPDPVEGVTQEEEAPAQIEIPRLSALEWEMWAKLNWERYSRGLDILDIDESLMQIARVRSQGMADGNYFSHSMPDGRNVFSLLDEGDVQYRYAGENLARNNARDEESVVISVTAFMKSPSHGANILSPYYTKMAVGEVTSSNGIKVYTVLFLG